MYYTRTTVVSRKQTESTLFLGTIKHEDEKQKEQRISWEIHHLSHKSQKQLFLIVVLTNTVYIMNKNLKKRIVRIDRFPDSLAKSRVIEPLNI